MDGSWFSRAAVGVLTAAVAAVDIPACGASVRRLVNGDRHYLLRMPEHKACAAGDSLPLAVLIHCYGCAASMEIDKYRNAADKLGFAIVAPEGVHHSFNAPSCCGTAHDTQVDDVGLVDSIVTELLASGNGRFVPSALFVTGFSNGGFLASHLADASRHAWAAIAPTAGHEYSLRRDTPLPVQIHHCDGDQMVNQSGCCTLHSPFGEQPTCCCQITAHTCVSTRAIFAKWLFVNRCIGGVRTVMRPEIGAKCTIGAGCAAETSLCFHDRGCRHSDWASSFEGAEAVLSFFARQVCKRHGSASGLDATVEGVASASSKEICRCARGRTGVHCLQEPTAARSGPPSARKLARAQRNFDL